MAAQCASADASGRKTTWQMPLRSRRSTNIRLPWSRRRDTQPHSTIRLPASAARSRPQQAVLSSFTKDLLSEPRQLGDGNGPLLAAAHVTEGVTSGGNLLLADDQDQGNAEPVGSP